MVQYQQIDIFVLNLSYDTASSSW